MKLRHLIAIFSFLAAFGLSFLFVAFTLPKGCTAVTSNIKSPSPADTETELQTRIRKFLEEDRKTGRELSRNLTYFQDRTDELAAETITTGILVREMRQVACLNLPDDFCSAWEAHYQAWSKKDKFLQQYNLAEKIKLDENLREENLNLTSEINQTYNKMLKAAEKYGVYFSY